MVVRIWTMPPFGRRGGVSSLLDVVNRKVIAKAAYPGSRYGSLLEEILDGVDVSFPIVKDTTVLDGETVCKPGADDRLLTKKKASKEKSPEDEKRKIKEKYKKVKKQSLDDVQRALRETLVAKIKEMRREANGLGAGGCLLREEEIEVEVEAMRRIMGSGAMGWVEELMRLWGVPGEVGRLPYVAQRIDSSVERVYTEWIMGKNHDERLWWLLGGVQGEGVRRESLDLLVRIMLAKHRSSLYSENLDAAVETVLFAVNPEGFARSYTMKDFQDVHLCKSLRLFERDGAFESVMQALEPQRFTGLAEDIKTITRLQGGTARVRQGISAEALNKYFKDRELLTPRAARALMSRHSTGPGGIFTMKDFVRLYLALTDCSSAVGIRYWFAVLDHDYDGTIGVSDVAHFYSARRAAGEEASAVILADVTSLWTRLCASARIDFRGKGIRLHDLKGMNANDREFILCALLIRRVDDSALVNVAATLAKSSNVANTKAVIVT